MTARDSHGVTCPVGRSPSTRSRTAASCICDEGFLTFIHYIAVMTAWCILAGSATLRTSRRPSQVRVTPSAFTAASSRRTSHYLQHRCFTYNPVLPLNHPSFGGSCTAASTGAWHQHGHQHGHQPGSNFCTGKILSPPESVGRSPTAFPVEKQS